VAVVTTATWQHWWACVVGGGELGGVGPWGKKFRQQQYVCCCLSMTPKTGSPVYCPFGPSLPGVLEKCTHAQQDDNFRHSCLQIIKYILYIFIFVFIVLMEILNAFVEILLIQIMEKTQRNLYFVIDNL
jgi:hypothetical protein